jgi:hypothetical protein
MKKPQLGRAQALRLYDPATAALGAQGDVK